MSTAPDLVADPAPDVAAPASTYEPATRALAGLFDLFGAVRGRMRDSLRRDEEPLAPMHLRVLKHCLAHPGASQQALVRSSGRDKGQIARLIKEVEAQGLLVREADPADGRSQRLELTAAGRAACRRFDRHEAAIAERLFGAMAASEVEALTRQLAALRERLQTSDDASRAPAGRHHHGRGRTRSARRCTTAD